MINMIVAHDEGHVIGDSKSNDMPWRIKEDLQYFKGVTMGKVVVMGRKTFESIGKKLEGRENVVITKDKDFKCEGVVVYHDVLECIKGLHSKTVFVIGGGSIYEQFLDFANTLYITEVCGKHGGDVYFPLYEDSFKLVWSSEEIKSSSGKSFYFTRWERCC